jgi:tetratricopeptide (TPR) repeat protein
MKNAWRSPGPGAALIILLAMVAYIPALRAGFVWDDNAYVTENLALRSPEGLRWIWTIQATDQRYYPLAFTGLWAEYHLWKAQPLGYHLVNILLHAVNAVLVWLILRRLKIPGGWMAALVFAVHPVNVATVAWVSEQKNTLSMFFYAVAILLYLRFDDEEGRWWWYGWSLAAFLLALLSKTAVAMLPLVLLGCGWWRRGGVRRKDLLRSVPFFALSLGLGSLTIWVENSANREFHVRTVGFLSRLADAGWTPWFYLYKALWPVNLTVIYPMWEIDASRWVSYVPGLILIGGLAWFWWKRQTWGRPLFFGFGYFVVMLFPVLGFFDQSFYYYSLVADHWQYYSIVGVIALAVAAGERICRRMGNRSRWLETMAGGALLLVLGAATWERSSVYAGAETLWRDNLAKNPNAWLAHYNLGVALEETDRLPEAAEHWKQTLQLKPDYPEAHNGLGIALVQQGRVPEAVEHFEEALRFKPGYAGAHHNLARALVMLGRTPEAIGHWEEALRLRPDYPEAHNDLGSALAQLGRIPEAIAHFEEALRLRPDYAEAHYNLGVALVGMGKVPQAMEHWEEALRIQPDYAEAHYNLGLALERSGKPEEAIQHYQQALRIKPDYTGARNALSRLHAGQ